MRRESGTLEKRGWTNRDVQAILVASNTIPQHKLTVGSLSSRMAWLRRGPRGRLVLGAGVRLASSGDTGGQTSLDPF